MAKDRKGGAASGTFLLKWLETDAKGCTDVLQVAWFASEGTQDRTHTVKGRKGGSSKAKCVVEVRGRTARLDYSKFEKFNEDHEMALGVMVLRFLDAERSHLSAKIDWIPKAGVATHPDVHVTEDTETDIENDIDAIFARKTLSASQRKALVNARLGQGQYRRDVMVNWDYACAVTRCGQEEILRASHIKPWHACASDAEKRDPRNGLLLVANLDALFDNHLITFDRKGRIQVSRHVSPAESKHLGLAGLRLSREPTKRELDYLRHHQREFERQNKP